MRSQTIINIVNSLLTFYLYLNSTINLLSVTLLVWEIQKFTNFQQILQKHKQRLKNVINAIFDHY